MKSYWKKHLKRSLKREEIDLKKTELDRVGYALDKAHRQVRRESAPPLEQAPAPVYVFFGILTVFILLLLPPALVLGGAVGSWALWAQAALLGALAGAGVMVWRRATRVR